uniref:Uncharacterized protein n=1 Tax=Anguilla anguilla TaxID=7936 RepID=A0A0E9RLP3_ANGAN
MSGGVEIFTLWQSIFWGSIFIDICLNHRLVLLEIRSTSKINKWFLVLVMFPLQME